MDSNEPQQEPARSGNGRRRQHLFADLSAIGVVLLAVVLIGVLNLTDVMGDHAKANIGTLIVGFAAVVVMLLWFALYGPLRWWIRLLPLVAFVLFCSVFFSLYRPDETTGDLFPRFVRRGTPKPDTLLDQPTATDAIAAVDLLTTTDDDFPQFLGPNRNATITRLKLARDWDTSPPELIWRQKIGAGWSGFAVVNGHALTMEQRGDAEMVTCYNVATGDLEWFHSTPVRYDSTIAGIGPRATPTIDRGMVYTLGATGRLFCLDGATGKPVWQKDLLEEYGMSEADEASEVSFGRANSPLVVDGKVIIPAGGTEERGWVSLVAYDSMTGEMIWQGGNRQIAYSSPVLATLGGMEQVLIVNEDYVTGHDPQTGAVLWKYNWPGKSNNDANVSQPLPLSPDRVFLSKGYGHGAALVQLVPNDDDTFTAEPIWQSTRVMRTKFTNVVLWQGHVFGLSDGILECIELQTGKRVWKEGRYGHGQILRVDELLLLLSESGELVLIEASSKQANHVLGQIQALDGKTWNTLALYGQYLLIRNAEEAACYKLALQP